MGKPETGQRPGRRLLAGMAAGAAVGSLAWVMSRPVASTGARVAAGPGDGADQEREAEAVFRVVLRPIASSLPLGFFAFTAVFALYGGLALLLEEGKQRMVLPLGRRGRARTSLEGSFAHQIQQAEQEAGVRRQL